MWPRSPERLRGAAACLAALVLVAASGASAQAPQLDPHLQSGASGPIVESPEAMRVTTTIQCFCGTCVNQTLHECTCGLAAGERRKVAAALAAGQTPEALIAAYVAQHGSQVRIVPERRGLNLIGWAVPFAAALAGLAALTMVLIGWRQRGLPAEAAGRPERAGFSPAERAYRERLERDLRELER